MIVTSTSYGFTILLESLRYMIDERNWWVLEKLEQMLNARSRIECNQEALDSNRVEGEEPKGMQLTIKDIRCLTGNSLPLEQMLSEPKEYKKELEETLEKLERIISERKGVNQCNQGALGNNGLEREEPGRVQLEQLIILRRLMGCTQEDFSQTISTYRGGELGKKHDKDNRSPLDCAPPLASDVIARSASPTG